MEHSLLSTKPLTSSPLALSSPVSCSSSAIKRRTAEGGCLYGEQGGVRSSHSSPCSFETDSGEEGTTLAKVTAWWTARSLQGEVHSGGRSTSLGDG